MGQKMDKKWGKNRAKLGLKWGKNGQKMGKKRGKKWCVGGDRGDRGDRAPPLRAEK